LFADSALSISLRLKIYPNIANNYNYLAKIYHDAGNLEEAARYWRASDSMNIQENEVLNEIYTIAMNEQEQIYDSRILNQSVMLDNSRRNVFILMGTIGVFFILVLIGWWNIRRRKDAQQDLAGMKEAFARRQKLAALGSLMGGIAHEINTPLASIRASLVAAEGFYPRLTNQPDLTSDEYVHFVELRDMEGDSNEVLLGMERRRVRQRLEEELEVKGINNSQEYSEMMIDIGFTQLSDPLRKLLKSPQGSFWFNKLYHARMGIRNNRNAIASVDQIQSVIKSFRTQVAEGSGAILDSINIRENIESVLVLLQNQLKYGVEVSVVSETERLKVSGSGARLSQVWTNLLVNSIQAMSGAEKQITIRIGQLGRYLRVTVTDTGHGILPVDQPYIFDNFYSTRHYDSGSGIGLNLTRQIVTEHHGHISFLSGEGFTEMNVFLPLAQ
jgi:signal transduction histidine kinase